MKFERPIQNIYEFAGVYVPALKIIDPAVDRLIRQDLALSGVDRLLKYLKDNPTTPLYDMADVQRADFVATAIMCTAGQPKVTLDDICHVWYMDAISRNLHNLKTVKPHDFYTNTLLRELKTFMITYKSAMTRELLTRHTNHVNAGTKL